MASWLGQQGAPCTELSYLSDLLDFLAILQIFEHIGSYLHPSMVVLSHDADNLICWPLGRLEAAEGGCKWPVCRMCLQGM